MAMRIETICDDDMTWNVWSHIIIESARNCGVLNGGYLHDADPPFPAKRTNLPTSQLLA